MIGFITPDGEFVECEYYGHGTKAQAYCKERYNIEFSIKQDAEDYLLSVGFLILRARDAYMSLRGKDGMPTMLTNEQLQWIEKNVEKLNEGQKNGLNKILFDQDLTVIRRL